MIFGYLKMIAQSTVTYNLEYTVRLADDLFGA